MFKCNVIEWMNELTKCLFKTFARMIQDNTIVYIAVHMQLCDL